MLLHNLYQKPTFLTNVTSVSPLNSLIATTEPIIRQRLELHHLVQGSKSNLATSQKCIHPICKRQTSCAHWHVCCGSVWDRYLCQHICAIYAFLYSTINILIKWIICQMGKDSESVDATRATLHNPINVYEELARQKKCVQGLHFLSSVCLL